MTVLELIEELKRVSNEVGVGMKGEACIARNIGSNPTTGAIFEFRCIDKLTIEEDSDDGTLFLAIYPE